jgi:enoyl-CoA hydratase
MTLLAIEKRNESLIIRFTRPELRNPLSVDVVIELLAIVRSVSSYNGVRRVIFTGSDNVFASGADLREIGELNAETARRFALRGQSLMDAISGLREQTIAAINGFCFGGALDLALACNMRFASLNAVFSHPGVGLGIITGWGGTQRLPRLIGAAAAFEMLFTAGRFDAEWALNKGLIDRIDDDPFDQALSIGTQT